MNDTLLPKLFVALQVVGVAMLTPATMLTSRRGTNCTDNLWAVLTALAMSSLAAPPVLAQPAENRTETTYNPPLFVLEDGDSRVYLLGSVHMLPEDALPLPAAVEAAYADAEVLAFELDMDRIPEEAPAMMTAATGETSVADALSAEQKAAFDAFVADLGLPAGAIDQFEPWMAGLTVATVVAQRAGASGEGVDAHFFARAKADDKPRVAFETVTEQVEMLDGLPTEAQVAFVMSSVDDGAEAAVAMLGAIVEAWMQGDDERLAALVHEGRATAPATFEALFTKRNAAWVPQIERLLTQPDADGEAQDALVVVGAGHLVGAESVVALLREAGYTVTRL